MVRGPSRDIGDSFHYHSPSLRPKVGFMSSLSATEQTFSIGAVARRAGVAVSTLRWWERMGLVVPAGRMSGKRRYDHANLRRIALIQLWQRASMSLDEIATVLAGSSSDRDWRDAVRARVAVCDEQLARITAARDYLSHLIECPNDHPADNCPYLADAINEILAGRSDTGWGSR
ncbi:MerR family transcriptional regulator [Nocardia sp. NPDC046763]|uniref:MerR family transcriptional regulator n=1 Tax=Nocardia sp. NPDC046763 TaxID=3155256 RepID=UPI0033CBC61A